MGRLNSPRFGSVGLDTRGLDMVVLLLPLHKPMDSLVAIIVFESKISDLGMEKWSFRWHEKREMTYNGFLICK